MRDWAYDYVEHVLAKTGWTMNQLAKEAGLAASTINRPFRQGADAGGMSRRTLKKIADASGIDPRPFESAAGGRRPGFAEDMIDFAQSPKAPTLSFSSGLNRMTFRVDGGVVEIIATVDLEGISKLREKLTLIEALLKD